MIIYDLNYLEKTSKKVFGGRGTNMNNFYTATKTVTAVVNENFTNTVTTNLGGLTGKVAELVISSDATGDNTFSSVIGGVQTEDNRSESFVNAISATIQNGTPNSQQVVRTH